MIEINNLADRRIDENFIREAVKIIFQKEGLKKDTKISFAFIGPERMRKLNRTYRRKNKVTDVLSFSGSSLDFRKSKTGLPKKLKEEIGGGEIVICLKEVKENASRFKTTFKEELGRIVIHGVLHLLGYEHEKLEKEAKAMREKEEKYLEEIRKLT